MFWKQLKVKFPKAWFKGTTVPVHAWGPPKWMTIPEYPGYENNRWAGTLRKRKADGKVGKLYKIYSFNRKFGQPRWEFRKFGKKNTNTFRDGYSFGRALEKKGFKLLGSGAYSYVYAKPDSDRVIKVTSSQDNWIDYVQWAAKKGYAGKYAPLVHSYKKIQGTKAVFSISVMERMDTTFHKLDKAHDFKMLSGLMHYSAHGNALATKMLDTVVPGVAQFVTDLYTEFGDEDRFDLHEGNFMVRKDGTFALTDPVCGDSKLTVTRLKAGDFTPAISRFLREFIESNFRRRGRWSQTYKDMASRSQRA